MNTISRTGRASGSALSHARTLIVKVGTIGDQLIVVMRSLWTDQEARQFRGDLGLRVYTSRLLGRDKSLVLHGAATPRSRSPKKTSLARRRRFST